MSPTQEKKAKKSCQEKKAKKTKTFTACITNP